MVHSIGRPPTIKDVAAHAGVSVATVSAVLNANKYVSPELAQRVHASVEALGYERNSLAQSLKTQTSHTIGLIISDIMNPFFTHVVRGVEDVANQHGYALILGNTDEDPEKEKNYIRLLESKRVDGLILAAAAGDHTYLRPLPQQRLPLVSLDRSLFEWGIDSILIDNMAGARKAVEHLIQLGHQHIGIITGIAGITTTQERLAGYKLALASHNIPIEPTLIASANSRIEGGAYAARQLLTQAAVRPTALFAMNGLLAIGVLHTLKELELRCPEDIALVSFDDFAWSSVLRPYLTVVSQPTYEMGQKAAQILFERLEKRNASPQEVRLQANLIIRESCGALLHSSASSLHDVGIEPASLSIRSAE
ncbi:LacI family DNA-binding transcriptional regulator [Dictyobacter aurantiacus]|uniref:LacI family transcriptional regulator n=1 Tax=Dictyobacter aurantiacus TaxID=1936993 RepID=A0A401Z9B3_9CHLR|nr:LacI family DNA-binding transcriptional regulator [Dictyobacter aurantiacus]GCE03461.1 LacI family transcriptional regulator [Dictyobacter aurantiacus]